ncbi:TRAP transporter 4TM/12TM fusion protein [Rhodopseudomonas thermotolerans]|uniref:TRAP transporter 4TM/12TM fusion protein n=2 Tax=Rhodopseudomonas TaxID=1073 RepID=A0A336JMX1_9BRAD|nr:MULTISPECIES: TRAP transporter permease [Rhodopseudomonas]RED42049.1 TRAP transporter 4TM/12TM fusion protein [Rhodopseudomonas pentothenatexigens]REG07510.1 TRAP transporter 4TM/12TM fusion protein [Rhodopseudomonas thermotolerans]SSW89409.1 TRAP transporter 4TM/12TM fusion protein [Rhodopseudomonas pentothenatexigens]
MRAAESVARPTKRIVLDDPHSVDNMQEAEVTRVRSLRGFWRWALVAAAAATILLCINQQFSLRFFVGHTQLNTEYFYLLIALMLPFTFLIFPASPTARLDRVPLYDVALFLLTIGAALVLMSTIRKAAEAGWEFGGAPTHVFIAGLVMWALLMEALRRTGGWSLLLCIFPFTVYPLFAGARWLGPLGGSQSTLEQATAYHVLSGESLLGIPIQAFADTVIGFLVFGTALMLTGAGKFFINLAFAICGTFRGGAAKVCIFASALLGMMSGSIISNVLTAGTMTIPVMKKSGFRASYAAAIEACASTGAVLAPPVMGATAFVIAQFVNVSYAEVALAAILPAALYYIGLFMQVDAYAARHGLEGIPRSELPSLWQTLKEGWYYAFVIALLVVMLLYFKRESHAPFYATALLLVLNQIFSKDTRWNLGSIVRFLEVNGRTFVELIGILAGCGLLIGAFSMTGVISSLAADLLRLAGDNAFLLLAMCAITSLILGLGLTTTACYIFLAILVAPALEKLGLNRMAVHMFIFYWGMLSSITPPVAIASFAAAGIAGSPAMKTGWESMWVGSIIYFIPFFFVMNPALVLQGPSPYLAALGLLGLAALGTVCICGGIQGYQVGVGDLRRAGALEWPLRVALVIGGFVLATPGGGINPLSQVQVTSLGLCLLVPTLAIALLLVRRGDPPRQAARPVL